MRPWKPLAQSSQWTRPRQQRVRVGEYVAAPPNECERARLQSRIGSNAPRALSVLFAIRYPRIALHAAQTVSHVMRIVHRFRRSPEAPIPMANSPVAVSPRPQIRRLPRKRSPRRPRTGMTATHSCRRTSTGALRESPGLSHRVIRQRDLAVQMGSKEGKDAPPGVVSLLS